MSRNTQIWCWPFRAELCWLRADATTPAKRLRVRDGYAATPQRGSRAKPDALDQAMVGLQAAERAITELQGVIAVRFHAQL